MSGKLANILKDSLKTSTLSKPPTAGRSNKPEESTDLGEIVVVGTRKRSGFSLSTFLTEISNQALLDTSRHLMMFTIPRGLLEHHNSNSIRQITLRCDTSTLPGISFAESEEIRRYGVGPTEKHPYLPIFGAIATSYIVDGSGDIHSFFYDWMSYMVGFDSSQGMSSVNGFGKSPYEVAYKDDYLSNATIFVYNELNDKVIELTLNSAYPIAINPVPLSWGNTDQFMRLDVTWDYIDWSVKYYTPDVSEGDIVGGPQPLRRDINRQEPLLNRFAQLVGTLPPSLGLQSFASDASSITQRIADIQNLVQGSQRTIIDNTRRGSF